MTNNNSPRQSDWYSAVPRSLGRPTMAGLTVVCVCLLGFGTWAATAPIDGAVVASGTFVAAGQNKQVQHLEGGIVSSVDVREGDLVEAHQTLIRLDPTAALAKLQRLILRKYRLVAMQSRLRAEIDGAADFALPADSDLNPSDPDLRLIEERQRMELRARRDTLGKQREVLTKEIGGLRESIAGYQSQIDATAEQVKLFDQELSDKTMLLDRDLARKTDVLSLQRARAGLNGQLGELTGRAADSRQQIARAEEQIASLQSTSTQRAIEDLRQTETELDDVNEQIRASRDVLNRTEIKAPVRGIVVKLDAHTTGGVIAAGGTLLELLPVNDDLIIEGRISPAQVTHVSRGQNATVRLSALNQRQTPMVGGHVIYVSADTVSDQQAGSATSRSSSFVVRVRLDDTDLEAKLPRFKATPGMPADIYIRTGERTLVTYLMEPVMGSLSKAFREY